MVVRRPDHAEAVPHGRFAFGVVGEGERVLRRCRGAVVEAGLEAVGTLSATEPVFDLGVRHGPVSRDPCVNVVLLRIAHAFFALFGRRAAAARADEFARASATRGVFVGGFGTTQAAVARDVDRAPVAVFLGVAVSRKDFEQDLSIGVMMVGRELFVEARAGRRVEPPRIAMGNDDRLMSPLIEFFKKCRGVGGGLMAVVGEVVRVDALFAGGGRGDLVVVGAGVPIHIAVLPVA